MTDKLVLPLGISVSSDIEVRADRARPFRARVRWVDPITKKRASKSEAFDTRDAAIDWVTRMERAAARGVDPNVATTTLSDYGQTNMTLALRGLEAKTTDPYLAGWRKRVVPALGHLPMTMITNGAVDRAVHGWIADECSRSTVKNSLAVLVRVMEQALRDGVIDRNPARVTGWQRQYKLAEDELDDPRALALPDWNALTTLASAAGGTVGGPLSRLGRCGDFRGMHRGPHRGSIRMPRAGYQYRRVDLDCPPSNNAVPWRLGG